MISAAMPRAPAGAVIVLVAAAVFGFSLLFGRSRGMVWLASDRYRLMVKTRRQHLLRALYEWSESHDEATGMTESDLMAARSWSRGSLRSVLRWAESHDFVRHDGSGGSRLTDRGEQEARRLVRNHRLWELYLVTHADVAPSHVDRDADQLEHVLGHELVDSLQAVLERDHPDLAMPASPHAIKLGRVNREDERP
jgi:manganese/zinc/iron transport system permease protein